MENEEPITVDQPIETGAQEALPEAPAEVSADNSEEPTVSDVSTDGAPGALPQVDDKLQSFAKGQGIEDVSELSEREQKLLKVAYDNNASFQRSRQQTSEMQKTMDSLSDEAVDNYASVTGQDPEVLKRVQRIEVRDSVRSFFDAKPEARQYEAEMAKIARESGLSGSPEAILQASYAIAVANNPDGVRSQAKREALQSLASKQSAAVPGGSATTQASAPSKITKANVDQLIAQNGQDWFQKNYETINQVLAS